MRLAGMYMFKRAFHLDYCILLEYNRNMDSPTKQHHTITLFGKTGEAVLSLLFSNSEKQYYLRQIARLTSCSLGAVQKEVKKLSQAGIITRSARKRQVFYQANPDMPAFKELREFILHTAAYEAKASGAKFKNAARASQNIRVPGEALSQFCTSHNINRLSFFGSVIRDDFRPDSDVDVLVEFVPGKEPGLFKLLEMQAELSQILDNRKVDLRTPQELNHLFRDEVIKEAENIYDKTG